jgi:hypothetical protein
MWKIEHDNAAKQAAQGRHGAEGGRCNKKPLPPNGGKGSQDRHARSTVGKVTAGADVSERKAAQAPAVVKFKPELVSKVKSLDITLNEAAKQARAAAQRVRHRQRVMLH